MHGHVVQGDRRNNPVTIASRVTVVTGRPDLTAVVPWYESVVVRGDDVVFRCELLTGGRLKSCASSCLLARHLTCFAAPLNPHFREVWLRGATSDETFNVDHSRKACHMLEEGQRARRRRARGLHFHAGRD
jgi:hypothetical protein